MAVVNRDHKLKDREFELRKQEKKANERLKKLQEEKAERVKRAMEEAFVRDIEELKEKNDKNGEYMIKIRVSCCCLVKESG